MRRCSEILIQNIEVISSSVQAKYAFYELIDETNYQQALLQIQANAAFAIPGFAIGAGTSYHEFQEKWRTFKRENRILIDTSAASTQFRQYLKDSQIEAWSRCSETGLSSSLGTCIGERMEVLFEWRNTNTDPQALVVDSIDWMDATPVDANLHGRILKGEEVIPVNGARAYTFTVVPDRMTSVRLNSRSPGGHTASASYEPLQVANTILGKYSGVCRRVHQGSETRRLDLDLSSLQSNSMAGIVTWHDESGWVQGPWRSIDNPLTNVPVPILLAAQRLTLREPTYGSYYLELSRTGNKLTGYMFIMLQELTVFGYVELNRLA